MARTTKEVTAEQRRTLIEWVIAISTIFWSVWWGFYMQGLIPVIDQEIAFPLPFISPPIVLKIPGSFLLAGNALIISVFAVTYVHWLWAVHKTSYNRFLVRSLVRASAPLALAMLWLLADILSTGTIVNISPSLMNYGLLLTLLWPGVVLMTIWRT